MDVGIDISTLEKGLLGATQDDYPGLYYISPPPPLTYITLETRGGRLINGRGGVELFDFELDFDKYRWRGWGRKWRMYMSKYTVLSRTVVVIVVVVVLVLVGVGVSR